MTTMKLRIFDVEHGACAMMVGPSGALAMIDCGHNSSTGRRPSTFLQSRMNKNYLDYLMITNVDQDHISDLSNLRASGIDIRNLMSNTLVSPQQLRAIKQQCGPITSDAEAYLQMRAGYGAPGSGTSFSQVMGDVGLMTFFHSPEIFTDTNNLSAVYFIRFGAFKIAFPGDIEDAGWRVHMQNPAFVQELRTTSILVASHHGRESGYSTTAFQNLKFQAVIISDKSIQHATQETIPDYRAVVRDEGINTTTESPRHVLTTRRDGDILIEVDSRGNFGVQLHAA